MNNIPVIYPRIIFDKASEFGMIDVSMHKKALAGEVVKIKIGENLYVDCMMSQFIPAKPNNKHNTYAHK